MTHEPKMSILLDDYIQGLMNEEEMLEFEKELETNAHMRDELMLIREIEEAITESDTKHLRLQIQAVMNKETIQTEKLSANFNLADETSLNDFLSQLPLSHEITENLEALPKIHVENHHRNESEVLHQVYREQMTKTEAVEQDVDFIFDDEWIDMEAAIQEKDIMNLRESLRQIQANVHSHSYSIEEMESYIEGSMGQKQLELFEDELSVNALLSSDLELLFELDEAMSESDIFELRDIVQMVMTKQTSSSHSLSDIESFIYNEMDETSRDVLVSELYENDDLKAELNLLREIDEALSEKDIQQLRAKLRDVSAEISVTEQKSFAPHYGSISGLRRFASAAAILIMILGTSLVIRFLAMPSSNIDILNESPVAMTAFRSALPNVDSYLSEGFQLYNTEDYNGALTCFGKVLELDHTNPAALFYSGASNQKLENYRYAVKNYRQVIEHNDNIFIEQAEWYMALCFIRMDEDEKTRVMLEAIVSRNGYYGTKAKVLIKNLKRKG